MCLCSQLCKMQYLWPELLGNPPLVALPLLSFQLMRLPCGRHPLPVRMYGSMYGGGAKYASKVKLWASWFCMDGGDEQAFLRSLDISAYLNQEVRDVEEDVVLFRNQFLTCTVILTGDGKGMQAMGGAGSHMYHRCPAQNIERETNIVRLLVAILGNLYRRACDMLRSVAWKFSKTLGKMLGSFGSQIGPPKRNRYR